MGSARRHFLQTKPGILPAGCNVACSWLKSRTRLGIGAHMMTESADRGNHPGTNIMFDLDCPGIWVHKIEVRAAEAGE